MAGNEVTVVAILSPVPGKKTRLIQILEALVNGVREFEPNTLQYEMCLHEDSEDIVFVEKYADPEARAFHREQPHFATAFRTIAEEHVLAKEPELRVLKRVDGFGRRDASS